MGILSWVPYTGSCSSPFPPLGMGGSCGGEERKWELDVTAQLCPRAGDIASLSLMKAGIILHLMGPLEGSCPSWICSLDEDNLLHCPLNLLSPGSGGTQIRVLPGGCLRLRGPGGKGASGPNINV